MKKSSISIENKANNSIPIKILISGHTNSYSINAKKNQKFSELFNTITSEFNLEAEKVKMIFNNTPIEKLKDDYISNLISKDKKPFIIIYFNEKAEKDNKTNLKNSTNSFSLEKNNKNNSPSKEKNISKF